MAKVNATSILKDTYRQADAFAEKAAEKMGATCKKGCAHCCYLLTSAVFVEGLNIAEELFRRGTWREWLPKLREASQKVCTKPLTRGSYFATKTPCVFLDTSDNHCQIYNFRPACCRYHYVISPPENCSPDAPKARTMNLDMLDLQKLVWKLSFDVEKQSGLRQGDIETIVAPIPLLVLFMMQLISTGKEKEEISKFCEDLPNPMRWAREYAMDIVEEEIDDITKPQAATEQEVAEMRAKTGK